MKKEKDTEFAEVEVMDLDQVAKNNQDLFPIPQMNLTVPQEQEVKKIISDEKLVGVYDEVLDNIRKDREEIDGLLSQFTDMVLNGGDATTSSKEALVNLIKIKLDTSDKMAKIADLMQRTRTNSTFHPKFLQNQNNTINIEAPQKLSPNEKRKIIEDANKNNKEI